MMNAAPTNQQLLDMATAELFRRLKADPEGFSNAALLQLMRHAAQRQQQAEKAAAEQAAMVAAVGGGSATTPAGVGRAAAMLQAMRSASRAYDASAAAPRNRAERRAAAKADEQ